MKTILLRLQPRQTGLHYQETKSGNQGGTKVPPYPLLSEYYFVGGDHFLTVIIDRL